MAKVLSFQEGMTKKLFDKKAIKEYTRNYKLKKGKQMSEENTQETPQPQEPTKQQVLEAKRSHYNQIQAAIQQRQQQYVEQATNISLNYAMKLLEMNKDMDPKEVVKKSVELGKEHLLEIAKQSNDIAKDAPIPSPLVEAVNRVSKEVEELEKEATPQE